MEPNDESGATLVVYPEDPPAPSKFRFYSTVVLLVIDLFAVAMLLGFVAMRAVR